MKIYIDTEFNEFGGDLISMEIRQDLSSAGSFMPHNALEDARAIMLHDISK